VAQHDEIPDASVESALSGLHEVRSIVGDPEPALPHPELEGLDAILADVGVAVIEADIRGHVLRMNAAAERITGWQLDEAQRASVDEVFQLAPPDSRGPEATLASTTGAAQPEHSALLERRDGQLIPIKHAMGRSRSGSVSPPGESGEVAATQIIVFRDVNAQQLLTLQLARQTRSDVLTGLLNRRMIAERLEQALESSRRRGVRHSLCYFDLDRFRLVNATCGHEAGDDLLQWVATRIHELVGPNDSVGRIGGDEFAILLSGRDQDSAERLVRDLQRRLLEFRFAWEDKTFSVGASFGLVFFGAEFGHASDVLSAADHACRLAKENGRGRVQVYLDQDDEVNRRRRSLQWVANLQRHLEDGKLRLFAQGIHPLDPALVEGAHCEILVRQVAEDGQLVSPVSIIQAAENSGIMDSIDRYVVRQALRTIGGMSQKALDRLHTCSINLSGISLTREGLLDYIVSELGRSNVPPRKICFEITETAALSNVGEVRWFMQELGAMGCRFAIDDFGSGQASYGYIENLPVDYVKIDGVFIRDLTENALHRAIVESVHRISCTLGIATVAESVETAPIAHLLREMGVHYAQGWLYGKPGPLIELCAGLETPGE
jgi:diguanylate cyclase (GGDEF)-like protein/PAS domain S-box-containing protein